ncbi:MAG: ABC-type glutathione transport system ATPase component, partial [Paracoccaceae bacterium]
MYQIKDLRLSFPDMARKPLLGPAPQVEILKGLSFDIPKGAVIGIVGGSGSGKSTLGRAMLRLLEPNTGSIIFDGTDITHLNEAALHGMRRRFQMVFQDPMSSLNPRKRVAGIIAGPLKL